ncbi:MAG: hypothetical protein PWQ20_1233 [Thermotogaceae bacterium]|jgi:transcriptional regulator with XRE-family HTH domain|nr:hypothetical protein [Thermotogaceae bacterium]MDN5338163.1 hypothetical protein [Thermotogaceae bacterium]
MKIGEKIRRLRLSRGLTQEELAVRTDLTRGFISQLENDKTSPSIVTLEKILTALGTDLKHFFADETEQKVVYAKNERVPVYDEPPGVKSSILIPDIETTKLDPILVVLNPGAQTEEEEYHEGREFGFVLSGRIELWLDDIKYKLKEGDCFYFKADKRHYVKNPDKKNKAKLLWIEIY